MFLKLKEDKHPISFRRSKADVLLTVIVPPAPDTGLVIFFFLILEIEFYTFQKHKFITAFRSFMLVP